MNGLRQRSNFLVYLVCLACCASAAATTTKRIRIETPGSNSAALELATQRLRDYAGVGVDVSPATDGARPDADVVILLGMSDAAPALRDAWKAHPHSPQDAYWIKAISGEPVTVLATGVGERGMLCAAYRLADLLRAKADLTNIDRFFTPRIARRFVSFGATTHSRREFRPDLFWKTLNELPSFGYSGIVIYPGGGLPTGRRSTPIGERESGELFIDPANTAKWKAMLARIDVHGLDIMLTVPPVVPPGFDLRAINTYYGGGPEPEGYLPALKSHFGAYLKMLRETYPEADLYMFNSTEGATFGRNERFFAAPNARYSAETYLANNRAVMKAYLDVLGAAFADDESKVAFWTHSFGLTSEGIAAMRQVLFEYPWVMIIEDDFWNNNLWPFELPAMNYLPPALREQVSSRNPFALFQIATDGEYYGGGSLPNAYPGSHVRSAREAVERRAAMVVQRLDLHDRTPWGTAFGAMEIVPLSASKQLWSPTPDEADIWREWAESRFGQDAAAAVVDALQESHTVLIKGLSCNGMDLLAVGSEFNPRLWTRGGAPLSRFHLFGKPGRLLVDKDDSDVITSAEYTAYQMKTRSIAIADFRRDQALARQAVERGLQHVARAKPSLVATDYDMLHGIFSNGANVLEAMRLLGETAYAANLVLHNFDDVDDPRRQLDEAADALETFIAAGRLVPQMNKNLATILKDFRSVTAQQ